ncbi:MAG TPA: DUF455 family protein [Limnochordia bacterium]|nr:DUF455 family protein [Limnochordia bacterium]
MPQPDPANGVAGERPGAAAPARTERPLGGAYSVAENGRLLRRYAEVEFQLMRLFGAWMPHIAAVDVKLKLPWHTNEDAEHAGWLRERLAELRGGRLHAAPDAPLRAALQAALHAPGPYAFLVGAYFGLKRELLAAYKLHLAGTDPLLDAPTVRVLRRIIPEEEAQLAWAEHGCDALCTSDAERAAALRWRDTVVAGLLDAGGVQGMAMDEREEPLPGEAIAAEAGSALAASGAAAAVEPTPFVHSPGGVRPEGAPRCWIRPAPGADDGERARTIWEFRWRRDELQATEIFMQCLYDFDDMPWDFYKDCARHAWDEARHTELGIRRLRELGVDPDELPMMVANSITQVGHMSGLERYTLTTLGHETAGMAGKTEHYRRHLELGDMVSAACVDYDWSDEINHVRYGKRWVSWFAESYGEGRSVTEILRAAQRRHRELIERLGSEFEANETRGST